ncbi:MAG TPA: FtsX-like permease family protein, partial [Myxococcaceae bacterium]|nr:FtsX-like permease family protein [Myxococcaceae bacterium]
VMVIGASEQYIDVSGYELASGRFVNDVDSENEAPVVVLGADIVETLMPGVNPIGSTVQVGGRPMRVIGTLARRGKMLDLDFDKAIVMPLKTALSRFGRGRSLTIGVMVKNQDEVDIAQDELVGILRRARATPPEAKDDFVINRPDQLMDMYNRLTGALYAVVAGIGFITLLVGGIGIMNIMLVSVRERTREIGVRRALGARKRTIVLQFLMEAAAVSAVGGLLGTIVGLGTAQVIAAISPLAATVKPMTVVFGIGFAALVGLLFGIWPAARAANLDPVEALRYE